MAGRVDPMGKTEAPNGIALAETLAALSGDGPSTPPPAVRSGADRFVPKSVLGEGGMGRVHDAEDTQFGRRVALKELTGEGAELERRFAIEALVTGNLEHPGIPAVYERGVRNGRPFYAMKKLAGRSLSEVIDRASTLEERLALVPIAIQVAHTLGFAHARGIVHRDVKPENVMVGAHGEVWLVDWGIAKVRGTKDGATKDDALPDGAAGATVHGSVMGTPAYMAPEQARGDVRAIDERTDVFALGAMLYHVLGGRAPYSGPTSVAALAAALEGQRTPLRTLAPDVPDALVSIVERAMAQAPKDRFPDAAALATALERFVAHAAVAKPSLVMRAIAALASVFALAMAGVGAFATMQGVSSFREQGWGAYPMLLFSIVGLGLSLLEWRTQGKHALLPLSIGIAFATFVGGFGALFQAYGFVARHVVEREAPADWAEVTLGGVWEASGIGATAAQLTLIQIIVIALVARAARLRALDERSRRV